VKIFWVNLLLLNCKKLGGGREIVTESKEFNNDKFFNCQITGNLDSVIDGISSEGAMEFVKTKYNSLKNRWIQIK